MQRVVILGSVGAGKTALALEISRRAQLPVVHLDPLFWRERWAPAPRDEDRRRLREAVEGDRWILDGNFLPEEGEAEDARFARADTVVFLDLPRRTCLRRVLSRRVGDRGRARPDLPEGCSEGLDLSMLGWVWRYPAVERPRVLRILERLDPRTAVHHLRSAAEVRRFLETL